MRSLNTRISLPPGVLENGRVRDLLRQVLEQFRWFKPARYGRAGDAGRLDPDDIDYEALITYYNEHQNITLTARTERDSLLIFPARPDAPPHTGGITWSTSVTEANKPAWRAAHQQQVAEMMQLLGAPLAWAGMADELRRKQWRLVPAPDGLGQLQMPTVRDYSEGLAGLFWRNFYGPPFVRLLGERLASLPEDTRQNLGGGITLVQPYALPTQAGTPEAEALERQLISQLGPECFYDFEHHRKPTRLPSLGAAGPR